MEESSRLEMGKERDRDEREHHNDDRTNRNLNEQMWNNEENSSVNLFNILDDDNKIMSECKIADSDLISWNEFNDKELSIDSDAKFIKPQLVEAINQQLLKKIKRNHFQTENDSIISSKDYNLMTEMNDLNNGDGAMSKMNNSNNNEKSNASNNSQQNEMNTLYNEQHQASIREFKRLGSYCTLRPEQRRKHLLKVLPALRQSNLLQTLLMQRNMNADGKNLSTTLNGRPNSDLGAFLTKLDEIVVSSRRGHMKNASAGSNIFLTNNGIPIDDHLASKRILFGSDNVEDCLIELDAYLEEIDREYALTCAHGSATNNNLIRQQTIIVNDDNDRNNNGASITMEKQDLTDDEPSSSTSMNLCSLETVEMGNVEMNYPDRDIDPPVVAGASASPADENTFDNTVFNKISRRMSCSDWNLDSSPSVNGISQNDDESMKRRCRNRRTIAAFKDISAVSNRTDQDRKNDVIKQKPVSGHRVESWRRHSMRKTRPILLPKPNDIPSNTLLAFNQSDIEFDHLDENSTITSADISSEQCVNNETNSYTSFSNEIDTTSMCQLSNENAQISGPHSLQTDDMLEILSVMDSSNDRSYLHVDLDDSDRPRQMGRRAEQRNRIVSITAERISEGDQRIIINRDNDALANASSMQSTISHFVTPNEPTISSNANDCSCVFNASEPSSGASSRNPSPVSIISSSASSSIGSTEAVDNDNRPSPRSSSDSGDSATATGSTSRNETRTSANDHFKSSVWPTSFSRIFAATCCTLGLFNISRFAIFSIHFGANFIVQFILLSFIFGIPMLWLQMCLGANIKGGPISMWRVSPICKGIGIALVMVQAMVALYSAVSISWIFVYLRDSCITSAYPWYRWQETFEFFRGASDYDNLFGNSTQIVTNSMKLGETVADYFNGVVLQRYQLGPGGRAALGGSLGAVRFQLGFNLAVTWLIVFIVLCKGLRSYGKIVIVFMVLPLVGLAALCIKLLTLINSSSFQSMFPTTDWQDFFINSQSWLSAAQEVFLTWTLHGASIISIFSQSAIVPQQKNTILRRDALCVIILTLTGLLLAAILGNACVHILNDNGYYYFPGSFETMTSSVFLMPSNAPLPVQLASSPSKWLSRYSSVLGESYHRIGPNSRAESGWQAIRLVTELFPSTLAAATHDHISTFWSLLGFVLFLCFALGQLCAMWKPIAGALGNYSSTSVTSSTVLLTCLSGLLLGVPLATESGINIIHFVDVVLGGAWFVLVLWTAQIFAIFLVRGRPYSGDILVNDLHLTQTLSAFVALSWNLLLPIGLMTLSVLEYRMSFSYGFYHWYSVLGPNYWPMWARKSASFVQIGILLIVPITAIIIQIYRYLSRGPPDILDRIQMLYRPTMSSGGSGERYPQPRTDRLHLRSNNARNEMDNVTVPGTAITLEGVASHSHIHDDAPPKYTPPPSYTTATGARIAKMLRNSIRRSVRRIMGESSGNRCRNERPGLQDFTSTQHQQSPPAYSTISYDHEMSNTQNIAVTEIGPRILYNSETIRHQTNDHHRRHTTTNFPIAHNTNTEATTITEKTPSVSACHTMPRLPSARRTIDPSTTRILTAQDVAQLLRPTATFHLPFQRGEEGRRNTLHLHHRPTSHDTLSSSMDDRTDNGISARSVDDLVANAALVGQSDAAASTINKNDNGNTNGL